MRRYSNFLSNPSFENGKAPWTFTSGENDVWCNGQYARRSLCFASFRSSDPYGVYMYQDVTTYAAKAGDDYSMEVSLRCPSGGASCNVVIYVQGIDGTVETRSQQFFLPANDLWYDCRIDNNHGFATNNPEQSFLYNHNTLRVTIGNFSGPGRWLDVDRAALGTWVAQVNETQGDPTDGPTTGPTCTAGDVW